MKSMVRLLLIQDQNSDMSIALSELALEEHHVESVSDVRSAVRKVVNGSYDLVLIDYDQKPGSFEILRQIRNRSDIPIIVLTSDGSEDSVVRALELNADDYLVKPVCIRELAARIRLRISRRPSEDGSWLTQSQETVEFGDISVDLIRYEIRKNDRVLSLTLKEMDLLCYLAKWAPLVLSRERILGDIWGYDYYGDKRTVDVTIRRLREKLEDDPSRPKYIKTRRGVGYYFDLPDKEGSPA